MNNTLSAASKTSSLICVWRQTNLPGMPLICAWIETGTEHETIAAHSSGDEHEGLTEIMKRFPVGAFTVLRAKAVCKVPRKDLGL